MGNLKKHKMGFSGFNFTKEAWELAPSFCSECNASIIFKPKGCVEWAGKYRNIWIDETRFISRPRLQNRKAPQQLLHLLYAFTNHKIRPIYEHEKIGMVCSNPRCVNPDHMIPVRKYRPLEYLFPNFVEEGIKPSHLRVKTYVFSRDMTFAKEFNTMDAASRFVKTSRRLVSRYARTGRILKSKWYIKRETVDISQLRELETEDIEEYEDGARDFA